MGIPGMSSQCAQCADRPVTSVAIATVERPGECEAREGAHRPRDSQGSVGIGDPAQQCVGHRSPAWLTAAW